MESYVLKRNEELCSQLAMNFDEANALFGNETLSSMQMVHVNGGGVTDWIKKAAQVAIKALKDTVKANLSVLEAGLEALGSIVPNMIADIEETSDGRRARVIIGPGQIIERDSVITDQNGVKKEYGVRTLTTLPQ